MNAVEVASVNTQSNTEVVSGQQVRQISAHFSARGLAREIGSEVEAQKQKEQLTRSLEPNAYRMSMMCDGYITCYYRRGKNLMNGADLLAYAKETRNLRIKNVDFSVMQPMDEHILSGEGEKRNLPAVRSLKTESLINRLAKLPREMMGMPKKVVQTIMQSKSLWFNSAKPNTHINSKHFPISAFAAVVAIAMSLMLIVASSVMVHQGESEFNQLKLEISDLGYEVSELKSNIHAESNLLNIQNVAIEEFGMINEEYIKTNYFSLRQEDNIEVFEEKKQETVGLAALLSAIGIR